MAYSWQESVKPAGTQDIQCDIEYLDKSYIHVYLDGAETTAFTWTSSTNIRLNSPLSAETAVLLIRKTEREYLYIEFASGAPFIEGNVDTQNTQFLHLAQELVEGRSIEGFYGDINMHRYRITNLGDPVDARDAANKQYVDAGDARLDVRIDAEAAARIAADDALDIRTTNLEQTFFNANTNSFPWWMVVPYDTKTITPGIPFTKAKIRLNGVTQTAGYSYSINNGTVTFAETVPAGTLVDMTIGVDTDVDTGAVASILGLLSSDKGFNYIGGVPFIYPEAYADSTGDWRMALQAALDAAHSNALSGSGPTTVLATGHYRISLNPNSLEVAGELAAGRSALNIRSGVTLTGGGTITLNGGVGGSSSGAILTNWDGSADSVTISNITFDGNVSQNAGTGITCVNILDSANVVCEGVRVLGSPSGGLYFRRAGSGTYGCSNLTVRGCVVTNTGYIGIQCERPDGAIISDCILQNIADNAVDIFGNDGASTAQGYANGIVISGVVARNVSVGVFLESCGNADVVGCRFEGFSNSGVFLNRINTASYQVNIKSNTFIGASLTASQGVRMKNAVGYCNIESNMFSNCIDSIATTGGMIYTHIGRNTHENIGRCFLYVPKTSNGCVYSYMERQYYRGVQTNGIPYNTTPRGYPSSGNTRFYRFGTEAPYSMYAAAVGEDNFVRGGGTLPSNSGWGPAYSLYNSPVANETVIALGSSSLAAGEFILVGGYYYQIYSVAASYSVVRKWDDSSQAFVAGDYTSLLNGALAYTIYRQAWGTV